MKKNVSEPTPEVVEEKAGQENTSPSSLEEQVTQLQTALEVSQAKVSAHWDEVLRAKAEVENARRIARIDVENAHKYGIERFVKELLAVVESLERGLESTAPDAPERQGLDLTYKQLITTLEKFEVTRIFPEGELFDPKRHEAISATPSDEPVNTILQVLQAGFALHERVLRPALVVVAKEKSSQQA